MTKRILITASRTWTNRVLIQQHLLTIAHHNIVVVHGACPKGGDQIADEICEFYQIPKERHPADWDRHGRRAGYVRNAHMVNLVADLCLAYIHNKSRGASMCADLAEKAGIPTRRFTC